MGFRLGDDTLISTYIKVDKITTPKDSTVHDVISQEDSTSTCMMSDTDPSDTISVTHEMDLDVGSQSDDRYLDLETLVYPSFDQLFLLDDVASDSTGLVNSAAHDSEDTPHGQPYFLFAGQQCDKGCTMSDYLASIVLPVFSSCIRERA